MGIPNLAPRSASDDTPTKGDIDSATGASGVEITSLTELTTPAVDDWYIIVDKSDTTDSASGTAKKIKRQTAEQLDANGNPLLASDPTRSAPSAGVILFAKSIGGRQLPAFLAPSGLESALQPALFRNAVGMWRPHPGGTGLTGLGLTLRGTGTATATAPTSANLATSTVALEFAVTTASTSAVGGFRVGTSATGLNLWRGNAAGLGGFTFQCRFRRMRAWPSTQRCFVGVASATGAPTDVQPSSLTNMIGVGYDAADSNWQIMSNDGTGTATKTDTGIARGTSDAQLLEVVIFCKPNDSHVYVTFTEIVSATSYTADITTDLPANTQFLTPRGYASVGGTSSTIGLGVVSVYTESDY